MTNMSPEPWSALNLTTATHSSLRLHEQATTNSEQCLSCLHTCQPTSPHDTNSSTAALVTDPVLHLP